MRDKLTVLNAYSWLEVQSPHNRREVQIVYFPKLPRTQSVVAVVSSPVVPGAEWHGRGIGGLLSEAMGPGVGGLNPASGSTNQARLGSNPSQILGIPRGLHVSGTSPPHFCSQCRQKAQ